MSKDLGRENWIPPTPWNVPHIQTDDIHSSFPTPLVNSTSEPSVLRNGVPSSLANMIPEPINPPRFHITDTNEYNKQHFSYTNFQPAPWPPMSELNQAEFALNSADDSQPLELNPYLITNSVASSMQANFQPSQISPIFPNLKNPLEGFPLMSPNSSALPNLHSSSYSERTSSQLPMIAPFSSNHSFNPSMSPSLGKPSQDPNLAPNGIQNMGLSVRDSNSSSYLFSNKHYIPPKNLASTQKDLVDKTLFKNSLPIKSSSVSGASVPNFTEYVAPGEQDAEVAAQKRHTLLIIEKKLKQRLVSLEQEEVSLQRQMVIFEQTSESNVGGVFHADYEAVKADVAKNAELQKKIRSQLAIIAEKKDYWIKMGIYLPSVEDVNISPPQFSKDLKKRKLQPSNSKISIKEYPGGKILGPKKELLKKPPYKPMEMPMKKEISFHMQSNKSKMNDSFSNNYLNMKVSNLSQRDSSVQKIMDAREAKAAKRREYRLKKRMEKYSQKDREDSMHPDRASNTFVKSSQHSISSSSSTTTTTSSSSSCNTITPEEYRHMNEVKRRFKDHIQTDHKRVLQPEFKEFSSLQHALEGLLSYHVYDDGLDSADIDNYDDTFAVVPPYLNEWKEKLKFKFKELIVKEALDCNQTLNLVQLERLEVISLAQEVNENKRRRNQLLKDQLTKSSPPHSELKADP
eukprot:Sdes_comp20559_c0_seq1m15374